MEGGRKEFKKIRTRLPVRSSKEVDTRKAPKQLMNSNKYNHIDETRMMSSSTQHFLQNEITRCERDRNLVYKIYGVHSGHRPWSCYDSWRYVDAGQWTCTPWSGTLASTKTRVRSVPPRERTFSSDGIAPLWDQPCTDTHTRLAHTTQLDFRRNVTTRLSISII